MKISLNWLKDYVALDASVDEICHAITFLGFEVEQVIRTGAPLLEHVVVGEVKVRDRHPNADKLSVCQVDIGPAGGMKTIVCGAQNYQAGDRVPVALPGAVLPGNFQIKQSKIRGESSDGMMCSAKELGVAEDAEGLLILPGNPEPGTPINAVLPPGDVVFDVEITPNRPDCLSHLGIARELAAWFKKDLVYPEVKFTGVAADAGSPQRPDLLKAVSVTADQECPLYTAHLITGVKIGPSPAWMQERLRAVGLRPINNVVDVGNYVMLENGQPVHAFDAKKIGGAEIRVRLAAEGEKILTLDGKERTLTGNMLVIADAAKPMVVAGIMGGEDSGVEGTTTDLVLECAYFKPQSVRRTSKRLTLTSDSAYRFERGVDPHGLLEAAHRTVDLILATAGGQVVGPAFAVGAEMPWEREIVLMPQFVRERIGFDIPDAEMEAALESLELTLDRKETAPDGAAQWTVGIPSWRDDLDRPIDLVEEILRLHGTDRIPPSVVQSPGIVGEDDPIVLFNRRATDYLVGHDFHECVNYTLRSSKELSTWVSEAAAADLALANPFAEDQSHLRPTLILALLESLKLNRSRGVAVSRLFETGRVFIEMNGRNQECVAAGFVIAEPLGERSWLPRPGPDFYDAKRHITAVAEAAGIAFARQPLAAPGGAFFGWQEGHGATVGEMAQGWTARFGLLNMAMVRAAGVEGKVYAGIFAILPEKLTAVTRHRRFVPFSLYPAALRDLALLVDVATPAEEVRKVLAKSARAAVGNAFALEKVEVFDVYQGQGLPEGRKSLAFSLVFRSDTRTLTDEEVNAVFQKIQDDVAAGTPFQIRK